MKKMFHLLSCAALLFVCGCRTQLVTLDVVPADARVIANGVEYNNHSPIFIEAETGKQLAITAYKEGYREKIHVIDYHLSTLGKIEAWTSILILPAIGLFCDDAWELEENNVSLRLEPLTPAAKAESLKTPKLVVPVDNSKSVSSASADKDDYARQVFNEL